MGLITQTRQMTPKPKPIAQGKRQKPKKVKLRKILEKQLEAMVKQIIFWRDGQECVQKHMGGCGNGLMWGHYIAQGQSAWLRHDLGNVFVQCGNHNLKDHNGDKSYAVWFMQTFGMRAAEFLEHEKAEHLGGKQRTIEQLETLLAHYDELYQNRYTVDLDVKELIKAGYFGEIVRKAWFE